MASTDVFALRHRGLDSFLLAPIGVEVSGMTLTVLSAFGRADLDPWQEAARIAKLPKAVAVEGLARLIADLPADLWPLPVATTIARRLIGLLPSDNVAPATAANVRLRSCKFFGSWTIAWRRLSEAFNTRK